MNNFMNSLKELPVCFFELESDVDKHLGLSISDDMFFETLKNQEEMPHLGNLYANLLFSELQSMLMDQYGFEDSEIDYYVNALDTHFYIMGERVDTWVEIKEKIDRLYEPELNHGPSM